MGTLQAGTVLALLTTLSGTWGFEWLPGNLENGVTKLVCVGDGVDLQWLYKDFVGEVDVNEDWSFLRQGAASSKLLASLFRGHFFTEPNIHQQMTYLNPSGVHLDNVSTTDDGIYTFRVNVNLNSFLMVHETNVTLLVVDPAVANNKTMIVTRMPEVVYDNATGEFHIQLACAPSDSLGNIPVGVFFTLPSGQRLNSTGLDNGHFTVNVPNTPGEGQYTCEVINPNDTCLPAGASLLQPAVTFVDGCKAKLDVATATLIAVQKELEKEKQANDQCMAALTARPPPCVDHVIYDYPCNRMSGICHSRASTACPRFCHLCLADPGIPNTVQRTPTEACYDRVGDGLTCDQLTDVCTRDSQLANLLCPRFCGICSTSPTTAPPTTLSVSHTTHTRRPHTTDLTTEAPTTEAPTTEAPTTVTSMPETTTVGCFDKFVGDCSVDFAGMCGITFVQQVCNKTCGFCP